RVLKALELWQTDVMEFPSYVRMGYIHVSIDTFSGLIWATAHVSTKARDVKKHLLSCFAVMGVPTQVKRDNGLGYRAELLTHFLQAWGVSHSFGIPRNSTGQAIVE
ncbi:POK25 protein, partial [Chauna torquata]|nr:POK25 protein [Chauna torquata]